MAFFIAKKRNGGIRFVHDNQEIKQHGGIGNMRGFKSRKEVESVKEQYPVGTRIELVQMEDPYAPVESGMQGTVKIVDDAGTYG